MRLPQEVAEGDKNLAARNRVISALRKMGLYEAADIVKVYLIPFLFCAFRWLILSPRPLH